MMRIAEGFLMRLFHFSDDPNIAVFNPRPVRVPSERPPRKEWLNGPLVWAIDEMHEPMYLFPRECPRILIWPVGSTSERDRIEWFPNGSPRVIAHIERAWLERLSCESLVRYEFPLDKFENLKDAGMWVSRAPVRPLASRVLSDLPAELKRREVELLVLESLLPLRDIWKTTLHASGIRLRNAQGWGQAPML
jgi:hypothetical protein